MNDIRIFVVNLERSDDRREFISKQLNRLNLKYEIFKAVDGANLTDEELESYDSSGAHAICARDLTRGEMGCSYSHLYIYKKMVAENISQALVIEDDVILNDDVVNILKNTACYPDNWELIFFSHNNAVSSIWGKKRLLKNYNIVRFVEHPHYTSGYLINRIGAEKLLNYGYPMRMPADLLTGDLKNTGVNLYGIKPVCIEQDKSFEETITGRFELNREKYLNKVKADNSYTLKMIDFYRTIKKKSRVLKNIIQMLKNLKRIKYFLKKIKRI